MNSIKGKIITRNIYLCSFVSVLYVCCQGGGLPAAEADSGPGCWQGGKQGVGPHHAAGCVCVCVCVRARVCVREREGERARKGKERERESEKWDGQLILFTAEVLLRRRTGISLGEISELPE